LPWLLTRPPVIALGAAAVCAVPLVDGACPYAIAATRAVSQVILITAIVVAVVDV
jgi:hypothetical protein